MLKHLTQMTQDTTFTRRDAIRLAGAAALAGLLPGSLLAQDPAPATQPAKNLRYKVAACDWMMLKRQTPGAITRARECGCDGVETDMGPLSKNPTFTNKFLTDPGFKDLYLKTCKENNIEISSIAMSGFYAQPIATREIEKPIEDCIATMKMLDVKVAFLPFGVQGDLNAHPELRPVMVERMKKIAAGAEKAGVIIGIETSLSAAEDVKLLDEIGSPAIKIYFNFQNPIKAKRSLVEELQTLGKDRICQIHPTSDDVHNLPDDPEIDMPAVKKCLDEMGWSGWLVIERSRQANRGRDVVYNFSRNAAYLKKIFQA